MGLLNTTITQFSPTFTVVLEAGGTHACVPPAHIGQLILADLVCRQLISGNLSWLIFAEHIGGAISKQHNDPDNDRILPIYLHGDRA